jgi:hypothetical protein
MENISKVMVRKNGKQISCEPCRVSKIRCDHGLPKCRRCDVRGLSSKVHLFDTDSISDGGLDGIIVAGGLTESLPVLLSSRPLDPITEEGPSTSQRVSSQPIA